MSADPTSTTPIAEPPSGNPPAPPPRLVVEHLLGVSVVGWAHDPAAPGQERLVLVCGRQTFEPVLRRVPRADVSRALGLAPGLMPGFEFDLPLAAWAALGEPDAEFGLRLGESGTVVRPSWRPNAVELRRWMAAMAQGQDPARAQAALAALRPHLEEARRHAPADGPHVDSAPLLCNVEGPRGLLIVGWLADTPEQREPLRLRCNAGRYDVPVRRVSRGDVAAELGLLDDEVGFELEIPGTLWRDAGQAEALTLQVESAGGPIGGEWKLARADLVARLDEALAFDDPLQRGPQALLAMEHLAWTRQLDQVDAAARQALEVLAEAAGVAAWLRADPQALAAQAEVPLRKPFQIAPRGRLGRWLQQPANASRALSALAWMRRRPLFGRLATRWEVALTLATGLFDKRCYDEQIRPEERGGEPALRHYVEHGDARSLVPMQLFDARHYTGQLEGRRHPGVNRLLHYALEGRRRGLSPCAWFDPAYYLERNADVRSSGVDPLTHFVNWGWKEGRRPAARFEPTAGSRQSLMQRLAVARPPEGEAPQPVDPLKRYLLEGLPAGARPLEPHLLPWAVPSRLDGRDYLDLSAWRGLPRPSAQPQVDVIVPVYAGAQETLRCLWSVLSAACETPFELVVIDDSSPEPALSAHLRELAALGLVHLLVNEHNLGFVATVNRGLAVHADRDAVILNSDTRVHPGWLDRLVAHAQAEPRAASITPLSNNATICSYPRMLHSNWEKLEVDDAALDALAAEANRGLHVEAPTGVGFCMWMRRAVLEAIGPLDVERFGRGYGEENDWCLRAGAAGWTNLVATDVYVLHQGSVSFAGEASERTRAGLAVLAKQHPDYQPRIQAWIESDPMADARARLDAVRLRRAAQVQPGGGVVLMINHARGGGTARHKAEAAAQLRAQRGLGVVAMRPSRKPGHVALGTLAGTLDLPGLQSVPLLAPDGQAVSPRLTDLLGLLDVREVHLHHLVDHPPALRDRLGPLCAELGVPLQVTVHDYYFICPRINLVDASGHYCGEPDRDTCNRCLQRDELGRAAGRIAPWRGAHAELLRQAARVIVPDRDVAARLSNYFPAVRVQVEPHEPLHLPAVRRPRGELRKVLVLGALSPIKGFDVLLGLAKSHVAAQAGLQFTLLGYSSDDPALREAGVQVLGRYEDSTLAARIEEIAPDLILLPSVWPETFCYALTPAAESGRPVAVFDLGAQARRLKEAGADAIYLPIELAGQPEVLAKLLLSPGAARPAPGRL